MSLRTVSVQKQYGLISKKQKAPEKLKTSHTIFNNNSDSDDNNNNNDNTIAKVNQRLFQSRSNQAADPALLSALEEDSNIFDYDGNYDQIKANEAKKIQQHQLSQSSSKTQQSRYVTNLLATAKVREKEKERAYERRLLKERKAEDAEFGDKPKFLTAAYKKKLEEDKKWEYEDRLADELEKRTDVRKSGMEGFYKNLLTKNVALGGDVDVNAVSVYTAGSNRQAYVMNDNDKGSKASDNSSGNNATTSSDKETHSMSKITDSHKKDTSVTESLPKHTNINSDSTTDSSAANKPSVVTSSLMKEEAVQSARERYLARKRALSQQNSDDNSKRQAV